MSAAEVKSHKVEADAATSVVSLSAVSDSAPHRPGRHSLHRRSQIAPCESHGRKGNVEAHSADTGMHFPRHCVSNHHSTELFFFLSYVCQTFDETELNRNNFNSPLPFNFHGLA